MMLYSRRFGNRGRGGGESEGVWTKGDVVCGKYKWRTAKCVENNLVCLVFIFVC